MTKRYMNRIANALKERLTASVIFTWESSHDLFAQVNMIRIKFYPALDFGPGRKESIGLVMNIPS